MKRIKNAVPFFLVAIVASFCITVMPAPVSAASKLAKEACNTGSAGAKLDCANAYDKAKKSGPDSVKCSGASRKDCLKGVNALKTDVKNAAKAGVEASKSQKNTCKYSNKDVNKICKDAWQTAAVAKAKEIGAKASSESACNGLPGGSKAKDSCKKAYTDAKNKAGQKGKSECGTGDEAVATYFDICGGGDPTKGGKDNPIITIMLTIVSWMTGLVSLAAVGGILYGGILYTTAQDNAGQTQKGILFIVNATIGLVLWFAAYALINYIVPGGVFT